jgi:radical SAM superfamily enzyme YgiQ (UPF0313 family)
MKIQLIKPTRLDKNKQPIKYRKALMPPLSLAIIDRLTPDRHQVKVVNDIVEDIDYSSSYDLVGITAMTMQADRAYQVADRFREMGVKVIIGGIHAASLPHEAKKHADSVVIGEVEDIWHQVLADLENNRLKEFYKNTSPTDLRELIIPKWDNINMKIYAKQIGHKHPPIPVFTTRGCAFDCKFCSISNIYGKTYRIKPISNVIKEIDFINKRYYLFVDDNIVCDFDYSRELFKALIPKKITWISQISTHILKAPDLIELAGRSGCHLLVIGIESLNKNSLKSMNKGFNHPEAYGELLARMREARITPFPSIIFGFDEDTLDQVRLTMDFLMKNKVGAALFTVLTPFPGTKVCQEMNDAGRLITTNWSLYDCANMVYHPKNYTVNEFSTQFWRDYREYFSFRNMTKRLLYITSGARRPLADFSDHLFYMINSRIKVYSNFLPISEGIFRVKNKKVNQKDR